MTKKELRKQIDEILEVVYANGKEGLDKDRTIFFNGANLFAIILELIEKDKGWGTADSTEK